MERSQSYGRKNMPDIEERISAWREEMKQAGINEPDALVELENHLRAEIERQMAGGVDTQSSFENATHSIGSADLLAREFKKVRKEARATKEAQIVVTISLFTIAGLALVLAGLVFFRAGSFAELTAIQQLSAFVAITLTPLLALAGWLGYRFFPFVAKKKMRDAILVPGGILLALWWIIFFWGILPRNDFTMAQLLLAILWCFMMPSGIFMGVIAGIETAARKKVTVTDS